MDPTTLPVGEIPAAVLSAMVTLGLIAQGWRASAHLPNWVLYPMLFVAAFFAVLLWGSDMLATAVFFRHVLEAWFIALGTNRIASDAAKNTPLETHRTEPAPLKETDEHA